MQNNGLIINPDVIRSVADLEWVAGLLAKGFIFGKHKSEKLGSGVAFQQYRSYVPGDDIRSIDWKMYAKTEKFYVRQTTIETEHTFLFLLDQSASMSYEEDGFSKLDFSKILTATLTKIISNQGDYFQLVHPRLHLQKGRGNHHWQIITDRLYHMKAEGENPFVIPPMRKNVTIIWFTDLYAPYAAIDEYLRSLKNPETAVVVMHITGEKEKKLDFPSNAAFVDLETGERITSNAQKVHQAYQSAWNAHTQDVINLCYRYGIFYEEVILNSDIGGLLRNFLHKYQFVSLL